MDQLTTCNVNEVVCRDKLAENYQLTLQFLSASYCRAITCRCCVVFSACYAASRWPKKSVDAGLNIIMQLHKLALKWHRSWLLLHCRLYLLKFSMASTAEWCLFIWILLCCRVFWKEFVSFQHSFLLETMATQIKGLWNGTTSSNALP